MLKSKETLKNIMSYGGYLKGNIIKWVGIIIILFIFIPIFGSDGSLEPVWLYLIKINWEEGLRISQYSSNQFDFGFTVAFLQLITGLFFVLIGNSMINEFKARLGY